jgi:ABC-type Zn uptake system ZnuABC Zn-binding protein ZnuA
MTSREKILLIIAIVVLTTTTIIFSQTQGRSGATPTAAPEAPPAVTATIFPIYDIVRSIAGDAVAVNLILPPNAEPHTYEPSPQAVLSVAETDVVYAVGHGIDNWVTTIAQANDVSLKVVDDGIAPLASEEEDADANFDPHYWLSAKNAKIIARTVAGDLEGRFPASASVFSHNLATFETLMDSTDAEVRAVLSPVTNRSLATFHGAFRYFADAYGLKIVAVFEPFPGREPSPKYLADLKRGVEAAGVRVIYGEPAFSTAAIKSFADDNDLTLGELDDLGGAPGRESLAATLLWNAHAIAEHQR